MDTCSGTHAVPGLLTDYDPCPSCVIEAGETFVVLDAPDNSPDA